jgi:hypothetical protein
MPLRLIPGEKPKLTRYDPARRAALRAKLQVLAGGRGE